MAQNLIADTSWELASSVEVRKSTAMPFFVPRSQESSGSFIIRHLSATNEDTRNLHCITTTTLPNSEILVAGQQDDMLVVNVGRGTITKIVEGASNIVVMRKSPRLICCGSMTGEVTLRDPRTLRVEQRVQAHTGTLSDLDVSGNLLLTCGFSQRCVWLSDKYMMCRFWQMELTIS
ncbi:hypothetical protein BC936DRAFT_146880 [Jimgerdemannia flammicorona]|uniref:PAN2-PAN3 deadenylation complex catalytic subunit PAN2 N-terminal domain-containing protein n=1 Tax=Jimgerdemannia flammicorona TaxID=994334 RepID=A0A433D6M4_9FUNG|nr:hypothetical protein BC936DRAFT_146880 [Jimgerdemannia flammicorona]